MNELDLKLFLAKQLPERIHYFDTLKINGYSFVRKDSEPIEEIKDTEWPYIVGLVEGKLRPGQQIDYMTSFSCGPLFGPALTYMNSSWQQRTTALQKVMGEGV